MDNFKTVYHGSIIGEGLKTKYLERLLLNLKEENNYSLDVAIDKVYLSGVDKILESEELFVSPLRKIKQILSL